MESVSSTLRTERRGRAGLSTEPSVEGAGLSTEPAHNQYSPPRLCRKQGGPAHPACFRRDPEEATKAAVVGNEGENQDWGAVSIFKKFLSLGPKVSSLPL